jgi:hypothetical protein
MNLEGIAKRGPAVLLVTVLGIVGACDREEPAPEVVVAEPTPEERLQSAVQAWNNTSSFHFTLQLENRSINLDEAGLLSYSNVEGDVVAPDRMQAQTLVRTPVGNTEVAFIAVGEQSWLTNPLTRQWEAAPREAGGAVTGMFDPATGIGATLVEMDSLTYVGEETLDGVQVHHLSGQLPGTVLAGFAPDLQSVPRLDLEVYAGTEDERIRRIIVRQPPVGEVTPTWTFNFTNFDQPVTIQPPL